MKVKKLFQNYKEEMWILQEAAALMITKIKDVFREVDKKNDNLLMLYSKQIFYSINNLNIQG